MSIDWDARLGAHKALVLDLVEWVAREPRPYAEVMDAWRTSCPRFPVWEDATDLQLIVTLRGNGGEMVQVTQAGREFLQTYGRARCLQPQ